MAVNGRKIDSFFNRAEHLLVRAFLLVVLVRELFLRIK